MANSRVSRLLVLLVTALTVATRAEARQEWYNLNIVVINSQTNAGIPGASVTIDHDFGNGTVRSSDGSGFVNFGVNPSPIAYTASASGFQTNTASVTVENHTTAYIHLTPASAGGADTIPAVSTFTNRNITLRFWNVNSAGAVVQGWMEMTDANSSIHLWSWVHVNKATGHTERGPVYSEGDGIPYGWQPYLVGNPNWLGGMYRAMGAPDRTWMGIPCSNGGAIAAEVTRQNGWIFAEGIVVGFIGGIISGGNIPGAGAAASMWVIFQQLKMLNDMERQCKP